MPASEAAPASGAVSRPPAVHRRGAPWAAFAPLLVAPTLPLIRQALPKMGVSRRNTHVVFGGAVLASLAHAGYVMSSDSTVL